MSGLKYKVGDRVRIKSRVWYNENKDEYGNIDAGAGFIFHKDMSRWCGETMTILKVYETSYAMEDDYISQFFWTDEMIEGLVEDECPQDFIEKYCKSCGTQRCDRTKEYLNGCPYYNAYRCSKKEEETKPEPKFKVGDGVEVLKTGNTYTISQVKFNGIEFVYTLSITDNSACWFSEDELKPIHFIDIAIKPHNVRGDEIIKMLEELGGTNAFSFDGSDHNCVSPFAYYINDDKQIYVGGTGFLRKNGYKIHSLEELKKKEYPKTYEECCEILNYKPDFYDEDKYLIYGYMCDKLRSFQKLLVCLDAYWKIAGE